MNTWTPEQYRSEFDRLKSHLSNHPIWIADAVLGEYEHGGHHFLIESGCRGSIRIVCLDCDSFQLAFVTEAVSELIAKHIRGTDE